MPRKTRQTRLTAPLQLDAQKLKLPLQAEPSLLFQTGKVTVLDCPAVTRQLPALGVGTSQKQIPLSLLQVEPSGQPSEHWPTEPEVPVIQTSLAHEFWNVIVRGVCCATAVAASRKSVSMLREWTRKMEVKRIKRGRIEERRRGKNCGQDHRQKREYKRPA